MAETGLLEMFSNHGTVENVTIVRDKISQESKGHGFISMTDETGADRSIAALNGVKINGRTISVKVAEDKSVIKNSAPTSDNQEIRIKSEGVYNQYKAERNNGDMKVKRPRKKLN